jgi:hypothetical protein
MTTATLPAEFADLETWAETWSLETEEQRFTLRLETPMEELYAFYEAFAPRLVEAIEYCDKYPLDDLPEDVVNLLRLIYSLINVAMAVEIFRQPKTVDAADAVITRVKDPRP